jgi:hypothetical protein
LRGLLVCRVSVILLVNIRGGVSGSPFDLIRDLGAALFGELHHLRQVFSRSSSRGFVALLPEDHVFSGKTPDFNKQLTGCRSLNSTVEEPSFFAGAALWRAGWRSEVLPAAICLSTFFSGSAIFSAELDSGFVCHSFLHGKGL